MILASFYQGVSRYFGEPPRRDDALSDLDPTRSPQN